MSVPMAKAGVFRPPSPNDATALRLRSYPFHRLLKSFPPAGNLRASQAQLPRSARSVSLHRYLYEREPARHNRRTKAARIKTGSTRKCAPALWPTLAFIPILVLLHELHGMEQRLVAGVVLECRLPDFFALILRSLHPENPQVGRNFGTDSFIRLSQEAGSPVQIPQSIVPSPGYPGCSRWGKGEIASL